MLRFLQTNMREMNGSQVAVGNKKKTLETVATDTVLFDCGRRHVHIFHGKKTRSFTGLRDMQRLFFASIDGTINSGQIEGTSKAYIVPAAESTF